MSDLRAQNLALYAVLYGVKPTSTRFGLSKTLLSEAVSDLLSESSHPFFAALRADFRDKILDQGVQTISQKYHLSTMLAELLALTRETDAERSTECTTSPIDSAKRNLMKEFDSPQSEIAKVVEVQRPETPPVAVKAPQLSSQPSVPKESQLSSEEDLINLRKRSFKARLLRAVEWYKQGVSAELLSDKLNISNKYKIHMWGNWSQLPPEKIVELGKVQCAINQLCERQNYTLKQIEKVFESQPRDLIKVMYQNAVAGSATKKRKTDSSSE